MDHKIITNQDKPYARVPDFEMHEGDEGEDSDYILFGWVNEPLGGMNDLMGIFSTFEEALVEATSLAEQFMIDQYQIVDSDSFVVLQEGTVKDLVPSLIN